MPFHLIGLSRMPGPSIFNLNECRHTFGVSITIGNFCMLGPNTFIDLLIVKNGKDSALSDLIIDECMHPKANATALRGAIPRHRDILRRLQSTRIANNDSFISQKNRSPTRSEIFTVILEVVWANTACIAVIPWTAKRRTESPYDTLAVIYKRRLAFGQHSQGFYTLLETTIPIILNPYIFDYEKIITHTGVMFGATTNQPTDIPPILHAITVLSQEQIRPKPFPSFPPDIVRTIALIAIDLEHPKFYWRRQLLALGLISKSWSIVLDLFFEVHCEPRTKDKRWPLEFRHLGVEPRSCRASLMSLARTLAARPHKALLMRKFSLSNYSEDLILDPETAILDAAQVVLRCAHNLRDLELPLEFIYVQDLVQSLGEMKTLESAEMHFHWDRSFTSVPIFRAIYSWPSLTTLGVRGPYNEAGKGEIKLEIDATTDIDTQLPCSLRSLNLTYWSITGPIFVKFFDVLNPQMENLKLQNISGLSNADLYTGLEIIASSLTELDIVDCEILKDEDEEHAVDKLISRFSSLQGLGISSKHMSYRSIERRAGEGSLPHIFLVIHDVTEAASFLKDFPAAFERSSDCWKLVSIHSDRSTEPTPEDVFAINRTLAAARAVGIPIMYVDMSSRGLF